VGKQQKSIEQKPVKSEMRIEAIGIKANWEETKDQINFGFQLASIY